MNEAAFTSDTVIEIPRLFRLQWEAAQEAWVLLYPEGMVKLSPSAGEIMKRVDGRNSVAAIIAQLEAAFPGTELRHDVMDFLETAHGRGWVRQRA